MQEQRNTAASADALTRRRPGAPPAPEPTLLTVKQVEERHPGLAGRLRQWIHRADCGDPEFALLRPAIVRIGRSVFISEPHFRAFVGEHRGTIPPAPPRNKKLVTARHQR
jgi:hypothetical protein